MSDAAPPLPLLLLRATDAKEEARKEESGPRATSPQNYAEFCEAAISRLGHSLGIPAFFAGGDGPLFTASHHLRSGGRESPESARKG